jgi:hypothetical protein
MNVMLRLFLVSFGVATVSGLICPVVTALLSQLLGFNLSSILPGALPLFLPPYALALFFLLPYFIYRFRVLGLKTIMPIGIAYLIGPIAGIVVSLPILGMMTGQAL